MSADASSTFKPLSSTEGQTVEQHRGTGPAFRGGVRLGLGVIGLAGPLFADLDARRAAHPALEGLRNRTGETAAPGAGAHR